MKKVETVSYQEAKEKGFKTFNVCEHTVVDLTELKEGMHTISVNLPNGEAATFCIVPFYQISEGNNGTIDIKYHTQSGDSTMLGFTNDGKGQSMSAGLYTLDYKKEVK